MRRGMTMIELLVVVVVLVIMAGIAAPVAKHAIDSQRLLSGARVLRSQIEVAKARAKSHNIPVSVVLLASDGTVRDIGVSSAAATRYGGDIVGSRAKVQEIGPTGLRVTFDEDAMAGLNVHVDDWITFDHRHPAYKVVSVSLSGPPLWANLLPVDGFKPPIPDPPNWSYPNGLPGDPGTAKYPYVVYRRPEAIDAKVSMPGSACVDLTASGYGPSDTTFGTGSPVTGPLTLDFGPDGALRSVRIGGGVEQIPTSPLWLCIGSGEHVGDGENVKACQWVRIHPTTGKVDTLPTGWTPATPSLAEARGL